MSTASRSLPAGVDRRHAPGCSRVWASVLVLASMCGAPAAARAEGSWLVTEVSVGRPSDDAPAMIKRVVERLRARGQSVLDARSAASDVERKHSHAPVRLQPEEIDKLDAALHTLADHLASENLPAARSALEAVEDLTPEARDYLNRQLQRARRRFHTCLLAAHLFAKEGYDDDAFEQVRKCARDFPGFEPEEGPYLPDSIRKFFARAREELAAIRPATLQVELDGNPEQRCRVRVNGIDKGPAPATIADVRADEVRVQVDCDKRVGRIYVEPVEPGNNIMRIDPRLDRAIDTRGALALRYDDALTARDSRVLHAARLGRAIGVEHIIELVGEHLYRIDVPSEREVASASLAGQPLDQAVDELIDVEPAAPTEALADAERSDAPGASRSPFGTLGWISVGAAAVSGVAALVAWRVREGAAEDFNRKLCLDASDPSAFTNPPECSEATSRVSSAETAMLVAGVAGGAFLALGTVLLVLDANQPTERASHAARSCGAGPGDLGVACRMLF